MKKIIYCFFFVWLIGSHSFGQVAIGTGSTPPTPDPAAVLLLQGNGTSQGLIVPVVQNVNASAFGKEGMVVFDKASGRLQYHTGTGWVSVGGGSGSVGLRFQGNVLSLDPTGTSSIGLATPAPGSGTDQGRLLVWDGTQWSTTPRPTAVGQVLQWNGTTWLLSTITGGTGTVTNVTGTAPISVATGTSTPVVSLNPIADTNISPSANIQGSKLLDGSLALTKLSPGLATNGQVIQFNGTNWVPANLSGGGTISGVTAGTGLTGGGATGTVTLNLANTAVTPNTYGSATNIPQIAVDAQGRITSASNVPIAAVLPTLGGDISGASLSATTVTGIQGRGISAVAPSTNQVLQFNGTNWVPANLPGGGTVTNVTGTGPISVANGTTTPAISLNLTASDIPSLDATKITTGVFGTAQIPGLDAAKITSGVLPVSVGGTGRTTWNGLLIGAGATINDISNGSNGQVLTISGGNPTWQTPTPGGAAGGSLAGTYPNPTIAAGAITTAELAANSVATVDIANLAVTDAKINDVAPGKITQAGASSGQVLKWNGTAWAPAADNVGGGGAPTLSPGQIIVGDGTSNSAATVGQDATLNSTNGNITVQGLRGRPIAATAPTTNSVYQFDGTQWAPVVLAGGGTVSNIATGAGLTGGPITATGTISVAPGGIGTTELANTSVTTAKLAANAVTTSQIVDGTITDADISGTAAIAVTKLATGTNGQVLTVSGGVPTWQTSAALTNPMTTPNDMIIGGTAGAATRLAAGGNNQLLTTNGSGAITWAPQTNFVSAGSQAANLVLASPN
ncbi:MAG: beta strand repeat-containing protein, partial [Bacteroidota bacterium]